MKKAKNFLKKMIMTFTVILLFASMVGAEKARISDVYDQYTEAVRYINHGDYSSAFEILDSIKNSDVVYKHPKFENFNKYYVEASDGLWVQKADAYKSLGNYRYALECLDKVVDEDVSDEFTELKFLYGKQLYEKGNYDSALVLFKDLDYPGSVKYYFACIYEIRNLNVAHDYDVSVELYESGKYEEALFRFKLLADYKDSEEYVDEISNILYEQEQEKNENSGISP